MKKLYSYLKNYWYVPPLVVALVFCFFFYRSKVDTLLALITAATTDHKRDLEKISEITDATVNKVLKSSEKYAKTIEDINREEAKAVESIENDKTPLENQDPDFLADEMKRVFGND